MKRTTTITLSILAAAASSGVALGGQAAYSNFADFTANPGNAAQASAVTLANNPIVVPFASNTASMRVVLDNAADVSTLSVLTPTLFVNAQGGSSSPVVNLGAEPASGLDPRQSPTSAYDPSSLAPLRVSIFASAADVESRNAFASADFNDGEYNFSLWSESSNFYEVGFDLGATLSLAAGEWFIEVAQIDPAATQFFLAIGDGDGLHRFDPTTLNLENSNRQFALELGGGAVIPLPTGGAMALAGLALLGARRRR